MWIFELGPFEESTPAPQPAKWSCTFTGSSDKKKYLGTTTVYIRNGGVYEPWLSNVELYEGPYYKYVKIHTQGNYSKVF